MRPYHTLLPILLLFWIPTYGQYNVSKSATASNGMVVSPHPVATAIGLKVLQDGGNAYDAGIAIEFALAVCFPVAGNIGGGGFGVYRTAKGQVLTLDYREKAPAKATTTMYQDAAGKAIDSLSRFGALAAGVPGTVAGMAQLHNKLGAMPWAKLVAPAIIIAERGFALTAMDAQLLNNYRDKFMAVNKWQTAFRRTDGRLWQAQDTLKQPALANTLRLIQTNGAAGFYQGSVAASIVAEMKRHNGLITLQDLTSYQAQWRQPISFPFAAPDGQQYQVYSMGPPSSGGIILNQVLGMLANISASRWQAKQQDPIWRTQQLVETERLAYADRSEYLGDPDFYHIPVKQLTAPAYLKQRFDKDHVGVARLSITVKPSLVGYKLAKKSGTTQPKDAEHAETTHYTVVDRLGNALSTTTTLNGAFGSKLVAEGCGVLLNNEMDDFSAVAGSPNSYGLVGGVANAVEPNKRMLSSMSPTMITRRTKGKSEQLAFTIGTPGGSTIPTSVLQVLLGLTIDHLTPAAAVAKPRFHHQWLPDQILHEPLAFDAITSASLIKLGYKLVQTEKIGRVEAIQILPNGRLVGGADPRGDDTAAGY